MESKDYLKTEIAEVHLQTGILHVAFTIEDLHLPELKGHIAKIQAHFKEQLPLPVLVDYARLKKSSKESRDYIASAEMRSVFSAAAVMINSSLAKIAGNLFLQFSKPQYPTKLFTPGEEAKALEWLQQFKQK